jgi:hypothetical protein
MKKQMQLKHALTLAACVLGGIISSQAQTTTITVNSFDSGTPGVPPPSTGIWYGSSAIAYDTPDNTGNGGGSLYISATFSSGSDTPMTDYICFPPYDNLWYNGNPAGVPLTQYKAVQFDILWDNTSSLTIDQFNSLSPWPAAYLQSWAPTTYLSGSIGGLEVDAAGLGSPGPTIGNVNIPAAASNGWVTVQVPVNQANSSLDGAAGIYFHKWINQQWGISGSYTANFWIDNVEFIGSAATPPPTMQSLYKPSPGLNIFSTSPGLNDRQSAELVQSNGLTWYGQATTANPVTYSFTINGFPSDGATEYGMDAYLFLCPNPAYNDNAPDWNETNVVIASIQRTVNGAVLAFQYKANEAYGNDMYYGHGSYTNAPGSWDGVTPNYLESGNLGSVTNPTAVGTWTIKFTSNTNITLIAPGGATSSFIMPPYNASQFAEVNPKAFMVYLGMQPNNTASQSKPVVYSNFAITGTASPYSENFVTDTALDTTNIWNTTVATGGSKDLFLLPSGGLDWVQWTTPASGFKLLTSSDLLGTWTTQTNDLMVSGSGTISQLITTNDIPVGGNQFFELVK